MNSLRPERDELDRFKRRKGDQKGPAKPGAAPSRKVSPAAKKSRSPFLVLVVFALAGVSGLLAWGYVQQEARLVALKTELEDAVGFISQSKLSMARFEGELSETGAELEQSGSAVSKKLAFLDSEMRKLWGVSNDRNRRTIEANAEQIKALQSSFSKFQTEQTKVIAKIERNQSNFESLYGQLQRSIKAVESQVALVSSESSIIREAVNEEVDEMRRKLESIQALKSEISENKKAISAIDSSRKQLNTRVVDLGQKMNAVQLQLKSIVATP